MKKFVIVHENFVKQNLDKKTLDQISTQNISYRVYNDQAWNLSGIKPKAQQVLVRTYV